MNDSIGEIANGIATFLPKLVSSSIILLVGSIIMAIPVLILRWLFTRTRHHGTTIHFLGRERNKPSVICWIIFAFLNITTIRICIKNLI